MKLKVIGSNQTELETSGHVIFFSYSTPVAARLANGQFIKTSKKWSRTTSKHVNEWLNGINADTVDQSVLDSLLQRVQG